MKLMTVFAKNAHSLRNKETGKRVFILANGPSINSLNLSPLKNELVIGMNASTILDDKFDFHTKYYVVSDARFLGDAEKRQWATDKLSPDTIRVIRSDIRKHDDPDLSTRSHYVHPLGRDGFSKNLSAGFFFGCTTTMLAIQLAYYLGSLEIYILGCDLRYREETPRFYEEKNPQLEDAFTSIQLWNIVNAARQIEMDGGSITNCSPVSFLRPYLPYCDFNAEVSVEEDTRLLINR